MRAWRAEVPVDDNDRYENGQNVHDEREQQVLGYQRDYGAVSGLREYSDWFRIPFGMNARLHPL